MHDEPHIYTTAHEFTINLGKISPAMLDIHLQRSMHEREMATMLGEDVNDRACTSYVKEIAEGDHIKKWKLD